MTNYVKIPKFRVSFFFFFFFFFFFEKVNKGQLKMANVNYEK